MLETLTTLPRDAANYILATDWEELSKHLSICYTAAKVQQLFFPGEEASAPQPSSETHRKPGFLIALDDKAYREVYRYITEHSVLRFPDIHRLLDTKRKKARIMMDVMTHVVGWLTSESTAVICQQDNTKPLLRKYVVPILHEYALPHPVGQDTQGGIAPSPGQVSDGDATTRVLAERRSILLEQKVLDFVRSHMEAFQDPSTVLYLKLMPEEGDDSYGVRFKDDIWKGLYQIVKEVVGPRFQPMWRSVISDVREPYHLSHQPISSLTRAICSQLQNIPEVAENPALMSQHASMELAARIDHAVHQWVTKQCQQALDSKESDDGRPLSTESVQLIKSTRSKYKAPAESSPGQQEPDQPLATCATRQSKKQSGDKQATRHSLPSARPEPSARMEPSLPRIEDLPRTPRGLKIVRPPARPSPLKVNRTNNRARESMSSPPIPASQKKKRPAWTEGLTATSSSRSSN